MSFQRQFLDGYLRKLQCDSVWSKSEKAYFYFSGYALFYCILSFLQWVTFKKKKERNENSIPFFKFQLKCPHFL